MSSGASGLCGSVDRPNRTLRTESGWLSTSDGQDWQHYSRSLVMSNIVMWLATFAIVSTQRWLPFNPDSIPNMEPTLAFNTISSFTTNTNLQHYSGETGLSYFSQMMFATFLQFATAGPGSRPAWRYFAPSAETASCMSATSTSISLARA